MAAEKLDYDCGTRVYNGHKGTDIFLWPFEWYQVNNNLVEAVAAEAGIIVHKTDGHADDHCSCVNYLWNVVYVRHADGSVAYYGHLKKGSLTSKSVGQSVAKGEYLGIVASSGCSTGPHLHFEVYENPGQTKLIDPYTGSCNALNPVSWWTYQRPYRESTLNAHLTHEGIPVFGCPAANENPRLKNHFNPGETAYFATYYHDQVAGQISYLKILTPNGSTWKSWSHTAPGTYNASYWFWSHYLPPSSPHGTWTWQVSYLGQTYNHYFTVGNVTATSEEEGTSAFTLYPVPLRGVVHLAFGESDAWLRASLYLADACGRRVMELPLYSADSAFDLSSLGPGVYFVFGTIDGKSVRKRMVKL